MPECDQTRPEKDAAAQNCIALHSMDALPQVSGVPVDTDELADAVVVAAAELLALAPAPAPAPTPLLPGTQGAMGIRKRRGRSGTPRVLTAEETRFLVGRMQDFAVRPGKFRNRGLTTRHLPRIKTIEELPGLARFEATQQPWPSCQT